MTGRPRMASCWRRDLRLSCQWAQSGVSLRAILRWSGQANAPMKIKARAVSHGCFIYRGLFGNRVYVSLLNESQHASVLKCSDCPIATETGYDEH